MERIKDLICVYNNIFMTPKNSWDLKKLKFISGQGTLGGKNKHKASKFTGILETKVPSEAEIIPSGNEMTTIRESARDNEPEDKVDLLFRVTLDRGEDENGEKDKKKVAFFCSLSPETVKDFRLVSGKLRVKVDMSGFLMK